MSKMGVSEIGKLERVPLRNVWPHEAIDFTRWLQDNIELLNDALDLTLSGVERERGIGSFNIDLVAQDDEGGTVIIENQLERSNHDHLGKVLTYLSGLGARAAIWIVSDPRPEHVTAFNWLNQSSSAAFYMVKLEAVRISGSLPAPLFTLITGPSEETQEISATKRELAGRDSSRNELWREWWSELIRRSASVSKLHAHITPSGYHWIGVSSGISGLGFNYVATQDNCAVELYIDRGKDAAVENEAIFNRVLAARSAIEASFGGELSWERLEGKRACRIRYTLPNGGYRAAREEWPQIQDRAIHAMNRLERALRPYLDPRTLLATPHDLGGLAETLGMPTPAVLMTDSPEYDPAA